MSADARRSRGGRSIPALYGALTAGLVTVVTVVASVVAPASPPSIAEFGPSARERIEEARDNQGIGSPDRTGGKCSPDDAACVESEGTDSAAARAREVAAGRRCFGDPPRQTEDPHSPPCVFEIFKGDNGGATAPGVTGTEIRVAVPLPGISSDETYKAVANALIAHFNRRYEFYGRRLAPVFVKAAHRLKDPPANLATAEDLIAAKPFGVVSGFSMATNAVLHRRLARAGVVSIVSRTGATSINSGAPGFSSDSIDERFTWLLDPPLDVRLRAGATFVCRALNDRPASHAGTEYTTTSRRFAVVVVTEAGADPNPQPLESGLAGCNANFETFHVSGDSEDEQRQLMLQLKSNGFTTVLLVSSVYSGGLLRWSERLSYFPEWVDFGAAEAHVESVWTWPEWAGQSRHAFGLTSHVLLRPDSNVPAMWALREGDPNLDVDQLWVEGRYETLLVLASGVQGAGPNLTAETFASALRTMTFPNPSPGGPPHWQQGVGFGPGDPVFHDDYAIWWWNPSAPSQTKGSASGRGSFCYLDRGGRFTAERFPADADARLFSGSEQCR